jgi:nicotinamidase-related amidase
MKTALVLIDLQNDYFPGGSMELEGSLEAVLLTKELLARFRELSLPVFHVQHIAEEAEATFFRPNTVGAEIHATVRPRDNEALVVKRHPNSFRETDLLQGLRTADITNIVFAGMMTHMCVDTTVRAASDLDFTCTLAHDACATTALQFGNTKVDAPAVQVAYLAALNDGFASVQSVRQIVLGLN